MNIVTTFSKDGYNEYGKQWIESVQKNMPANSTATIYVDFDLRVDNSNFIIKNFDEEFPNHKIFISRVTSFFNNTEKNIGIGKKTVKFSYKAFVINNELKCNNDILIWLDGDAEIISPLKESEFKSLLNSNFLACQTEKQTHKYPHIESGVLIFNCSHPTTKIFQQKFEEYYLTDKLFQIKKPYDGYVIGRVLVENEFLFYDFNKDIRVIGKNSSKESTFQHPFLKNKFVHWIGQDKQLLQASVFHTSDSELNNIS